MSTSTAHGDEPIGLLGTESRIGETIPAGVTTYIPPQCKID